MAPWRHRWRHRTEPPPWWPADEPWPPGPRWRAWRSMRGRFVWRIAVLMGVFLALTVAAVSLVVWVIARVVPGGAATALVSAAVLILGAVIGVVAVGRALRRVTAPVVDVMEAAGRLSDGDYSARVAERGPPEVRRLTMAFNQMAARLQAHEEQRRSLLADLAHELRTPLAVIQGNLEALLDGVYPRDDVHLAPVLEETRVLSAVIEDLRVLALAETGALALHREPTDLPALIQETAAAFRQQGAETDVTITVEDAPATPALEIDPVRIRQVLSSLITNALQHTPGGGSITIACRVDGGAVEVCVADTGEGIAAEDLPRIFERFYKSRTSRGTGLGLTIAKNLVTLHGGRITAESVVGKGTTIRFTLPVGGG